MYTGERFYLRLLLQTAKGATSFKNLLLYERKECETYREKCEKLGILQHDGEWDSCLTEAALTKNARQLRQLFTIILVHCTPSDPVALWNKHKDALCDDRRFGTN